MKTIFCSWILFLPIVSLAQLISSEITFIKLSESTGYVLDSIENEKCKCIPYVNKKEFRYAALVQFPDSHMVIRIKRLNGDAFTDVHMTKSEVAALHTSALQISQGYSIMDTSTEKLMLNAISGNSTNYHYLNYSDIKFPVDLHEQNIQIDTRVYKSFKVGFGFGGGITFSNDLDGLLFTFEPAGRITDNLAIGLRIESMVPVSFEHPKDAITSVTINFQTYFGADKFRPLAGIGFGSYGGKNLESEFGFYPRLGFDQGHFSMSMDFNLIPKHNTKLYNYIGFRIGFFLGGGRK